MRRLANPVAPCDGQESSSWSPAGRCGVWPRTPPLHQVQHCCGSTATAQPDWKNTRAPAASTDPDTLPARHYLPRPSNPGLHLMQLSPELEPGHCPPSAPRRHPHRVASPATSCSPRLPSASRPAGRSSGTPGPLRSVTSTRTVLSQALTATVTVSPAAAEPLCRPRMPAAAVRLTRSRDAAGDLVVPLGASSTG
jgi:hypothetical protein